MYAMRFVVLAIALVAAGCATVQVTPLNAPPRPLQPREAAQVHLYLTQVPEAPYDEVYMIRSDAGDSEQALQALRKKAGELGCDAVIITGNADRIVSTANAKGGSDVSMREGFLGSCIAFR